MPMYEYACHDCGREFEALVRSDTVPECPGCHSKNLDKLLSVFATAAPVAEAVPLHGKTPEHGMARRHRRICRVAGLPAGPAVEHRAIGLGQFVPGQLARVVLEPWARQDIRGFHTSVRPGRRGELNLRAFDAGWLGAGQGWPCDTPCQGQADDQAPPRPR